MYQLIYQNKFFILGKPSEVLKQLQELASNYTTVKELLDSKFGEKQTDSGTFTD